MRISMSACLLAACAAHAPPTIPTAPPPEPPVAAPTLAWTEPVTAPSWGLSELFDALNARREERGATRLMLDRGLCVVAERVTDEYQRLGRGSESRVLALANRELQAFALSFQRSAAMVLVVERVDDAPELLKAALDPSMRYAGLVVAKAPAPVGPRGGYSVVLALGQ